MKIKNNAGALALISSIKEEYEDKPHYIELKRVRVSVVEEQKAYDMRLLLSVNPANFKYSQYIVALFDAQAKTGAAEPCTLSIVYTLEAAVEAFVASEFEGTLKYNMRLNRTREIVALEPA